MILVRVCPRGACPGPARLEKSFPGLPIFFCISLTVIVSPSTVTLAPPFSPLDFGLSLPAPGSVTSDSNSAVDWGGVLWLHLGQGGLSPEKGAQNEPSPPATYRLDKSRLGGVDFQHKSTHPASHLGGTTVKPASGLVVVGAWIRADEISPRSGGGRFRLVVVRWWGRLYLWKVKKGHLKIHFAVDVKTRQEVSMDVSSEKVGDGRRLKRLVRKAEESVRVRKEGPRRRGLRLEGELQLPRQGGDQASHQGGQDLGAEVRRELCEEEGGHRAAGAQAEGVVEDTQVRVRVEGRGGLLCHQTHLRGVRHRQEVREHGQGGGDEGVHLQRVRRDGVGRSHCPSRGHLRHYVRATEHHLRYLIEYPRPLIAPLLPRRICRRFREKDATSSSHGRRLGYHPSGEPMRRGIPRLTSPTGPALAEQTS